MCAQMGPINIHLLLKNKKKKRGQKSNQGLEVSPVAIQLATPLILGQKYQKEHCWAPSWAFL